MGYYTDFETRAKLRPSHRINTFAFANGAGQRYFLCNQLEAKTFAFANAAFAYANPPRGDVSPSCRRASAVSCHLPLYPTRLNEESCLPSYLLKSGLNVSSILVVGHTVERIIVPLGDADRAKIRRMLNDLRSERIEQHGLPASTPRVV